MAANGSPTRKRLTAPERRQQILRHATDEFIDAGYGARTRDIAARAGINEAMIYRHFDSKDALFEEAILAPLREWATQLPLLVDEIEQQESSEDRRAIRERAHRQLLDAAVDIMPLLGTALFSNVDRGRDIYRDDLGPVLEQSMDTIAQGLSGWSDRDPYVVFMTMWGFALAGALDQQFRAPDHDREALAREFSSLISHGLRGVPRGNPSTG